ncbi:MAG: formamidopyrimidine-DNA glycosylase [Candidatus Peribacteria bacterium]|nr:formamidopyrimidine-DNA glycosylase [Candidatus Peribacteria bacterium]
MPELPEVETTKRAIEPVLLGNTFHTVEVLRPNMTLFNKQFASSLAGKTVRTVERKGKYLLLHLTDSLTLILHLKMSGRLGLRHIDDAALTYERIRFHLHDNQVLIFNDPRTLGRATLLPTDAVMSYAALGSMGPDALTVTGQEFSDRLKKRRGILKSVLLNQSFVAGIGNIYADESCFVAGINPNRRTETLTDVERSVLHKAVIETLEKGIRNMGTSFSDFSDLFGKPGQNQKTLFVYGRNGKPCLACGTVLSRSVVGQRGTVWCGECQI